MMMLDTVLKLFFLSLYLPYLTGLVALQFAYNTLRTFFFTRSKSRPQVSETNVLVTSTDARVGVAIASAFSEKGANVLLVATEDVKPFEHKGVPVEVMKCDVTNKSALSELLQRRGRFDTAVVHTATMTPAGLSFEEETRTCFTKAVVGTFDTIFTVADHMRLHITNHKQQQQQQQGSPETFGNLILVCERGAFAPNLTMSSNAKAVVSLFGEHLRSKLSADSIRVSVVNYGWLSTSTKDNLLYRLLGTSPKSVADTVFNLVMSPNTYEVTVPLIGSLLSTAIGMIPFETRQLMIRALSSAIQLLRFVAYCINLPKPIKQQQQQQQQPIQQQKTTAATQPIASTSTVREPMAPIGSQARADDSSRGEANLTSSKSSDFFSEVLGAAALAAQLEQISHTGEVAAEAAAAEASNDGAFEPTVDEIADALQQVFTTQLDEEMDRQQQMEAESTETTAPLVMSSGAVLIPEPPVLFQAPVTDVIVFATTSDASGEEPENASGAEAEIESPNDQEGSSEGIDSAAAAPNTGDQMQSRNNRSKQPKAAKGANKRKQQRQQRSSAKSK